MSLPTTEEWTPVDGQRTYLFRLESAAGVRCEITNFGGIVTRLLAPGRDGQLADVVLGFDRLDDYLAGHPYFGAIVGRVANRIAGAEFELDGRRWPLRANDGPNHLHGGTRGWDRAVWDAEPASTPEGPALELRHVSDDGEEGYPGRVEALARYVLTDSGELRLRMEATADRTTLVNLTHHAYFNLAGHDSGSVLEQRVFIAADEYTPADEQRVPTGERARVRGTPFDFTEQKPLGKDFDRLTNRPVGYDENFVLRGPAGETRLAARADDPVSGRFLELYATAPGLQLYTGNFLDGSIRGKGAVYRQHGAFCLEPQAFPDAIHKPDWKEQVVLPSGERYVHEMVFRLGVDRG